MDLRTSLTDHSNETNAVISTFFASQRVEAEAIDRYLVRSLDLLETFSLRGGKDIRSFLSRLGYEIAGGKTHSGLIRALASVEMHHKHILVLDDIFDRDEQRYGGPTMEYAYRDVMVGQSDTIHRAMGFAMMDGVLLGALSKEMLLSSRFDAKILVEVMHILNTTMFRDTLAGWQIHGMQCTESIANSTQAEFIKGLKLVTASYTFEGPLLVGLTLAGNTNKNLEGHIREYAINVGTAFQIQDDILGLFGDPKVTGKPVGNDVREGKKTLLLQEAYARCSAGEKKVLDSACGQAISTDMLHEVQRIVTDTGSLQYSVDMAKDFVEKGIASLSPLPESEPKRMLIDLAHYIITREK